MTSASNGSTPRISLDDSHDLRDALAVTKGWLEVLFHQWDGMDDQERFHCVAGALLGANQMGCKLEAMDGHQIDLRDAPEMKMADEFFKLAEKNGS